MDNKYNLTIFADASFSTPEKPGGYGAYIRSKDIKLFVGGRLPLLRNSTLAEALGLLTAVQLAFKYGELHPDILMCIMVVDCQSIIDMDTKINEEGRDFIPSSNHMIQMKSIIVSIQDIMANIGVPYRINKVKGHSGKPSPRNYINNQVDKIASQYRLRGEASLLLGELNSSRRTNNHRRNQ